MKRVTRRGALEMAGQAGAAAVGFALGGRTAGQEPAGARSPVRKRIDEYDPTNAKVGHIVPATVRDDDILFLKQIGLRSILVNFRPEAASLDEMRTVQQRFAEHNIQIFGGLNYTYRSLKIQLGQAGRDEDIERYQMFLRNLGKLGIPVA